MDANAALFIAGAIFIAPTMERGIAIGAGLALMAMSVIFEVIRLLSGGG
jgi:hypothetical protein